MNALEIRAPLTHQGQALESSRDSGFDLSAAVGEPVDNSWEAGASTVRIQTVREDGGSITDIGIADNGAGIPAEILPNVLSVGYSSRYNSRKGLGRFGMGLKLAALSLGRRAEVYTKARGSRPSTGRCWISMMSRVASSVISPSRRWPHGLRISPT
ncbi:ATP-binding protein [Ramlibacter sp. MMS24-I3-19]|uniref:ATP-binding protein n=1 Tax=Ramlibacter sp. MMS24-I3-19 TaxID=3416606 RepID=UPI003D07E3F7